MIKRIFWNGIKVILPLALTIAVLYWLFIGIEHFFGYILELFIPPKYYFQGMGFVVGIIVVFVAGIFMTAWLGRKLHSWYELILRKIPLVKWLYNSLTDLMNFFESRKGTEHRSVVMVSLQGFRILGFVTREDFSELVEGLGLPGEVAVYLPMAYQIGGHMVNVPKEVVTPLDMSVEHAMRYILTAGMVSRK